jgi:CRP-like cAMP-binding protein
MCITYVSPYENVYEKGEKGMLLFVVGSGTFEVNGEEDGIANYVHEEQKVGDKRVSNFSRGSVVALNSGYDGSEGSVSSEISNSSNNNITATSSGNIDIAETRNRSGRAKSILDRPPTSTTNTNTTAGKRPKSDRWDSIQRSRGASVLRARRSSETMISGASHHSRNSSFMSSDLSVFSISERSSDMTASSRNSNLHGWSSLQATKLIENGVVRNCGNNRPTSTLLLSQGDCFGQEALFHEAVRTMTVSATKQGGTLWAVQKNVFHHIAVQAHMRAMHDVRRLLRRVRLFRENALTSDDIESLCELAEIHKLSKGYVLSESGYDLDFFLLVRKGKIELSHEEEDAPKDTMNHSMIMKRGNYIGLGCLLPPLNVKRPSIDSKTSVGYENRTKIEVKSNHSVCVLLSHSDFIRVIGHERYVQLKRSTGKSFFDQNFDERDRSCSVSSLNCGESPERRKSKKKQKFESQLNLRTPSNPSINGSKSLKIKKHSNMTSSTRKEKEFNRSLSVGDNSHRPAPPSPRLSTRRHNKGIESSDSIDMGGLRACDPALLIPVALEDSIVASEQYQVVVLTMVMMVIIVEFWIKIFLIYGD